ncbi:MAG: hypothetical protein JNJ46_26665 [Myxococcales bacterium]|nr:hypothetical protein [Myxococcales bacterium]
MLLKLMHEGGFPMWFIVLFGGSALVSAVLYAKTLSPRYAALARGLALSTLMATLAGTAAALGATFAALAGDRFPELNILKPDGPQVLLKGLAESMSPSIMGFALLALVGLFYGVGSFRRGHE